MPAPETGNHERVEGADRMLDLLLVTLTVVAFAALFAVIAGLERV